MKTRKPHRKPVPRQPTPASLHDAALAYLGRYAATEAGLLRILDRRVKLWVQAVPEEERHLEAGLRQAARDVVARLAASGAVSDSVFAASRARSLQRSGKSSRAIGAHLAARGVAADLAAAATPQDQAAEAAAAAIHMRRRRLGPFRSNADSPEQQRRELASLARAGFSHEVARHALLLSSDEAEAVIASFRSAL